MTCPSEHPTQDQEIHSRIHSLQEEYAALDRRHRAHSLCISIFDEGFGPIADMRRIETRMTAIEEELRQLEASQER